MLKKIGFWLVVFGLSFLVRNFGWTEQGKAFLYIYLGAAALIAVILLIIYHSALGWAASIFLILVTILSMALSLVASWGATKLFDVDFYVAYQIMTFGQCLVYSSNKNN